VRQAAFIEPMLALAVTRLPSSDDWEYELKLDGYRALAVKHNSELTLYSRNEKRFNKRYPALVQALTSLPDETILDGEIVALDESGRPNFHRLQNATVDTPLTFFAFDLLMWEGQDMRERHLDERRESLRGVVPGLPDVIRFSESFQVRAEEMVAAVTKQGLEGIVAKRRDSRYESGKRTGAWVKLRIGGRQEFVIGGYVPHGSSFDSLIVGYYEGKKLMYAARVRAGFAPLLRTEIVTRLKPLNIASCPFVNLPEQKKGRWGEGLTKEDMKKCIWVKPKLVAEISYAELTPANRLRHPTFIALRDDKEPKQVLLEKP
jgi:DNA ligase D-like protein (predicted ligase)